MLLLLNVDRFQIALEVSFQLKVSQLTLILQLLVFLLLNILDYRVVRCIFRLLHGGIIAPIK
jgi:hypothetical protein